MSYTNNEAQHQCEKCGNTDTFWTHDKTGECLKCKKDGNNNDEA